MELIIIPLLAIITCFLMVGTSGAVKEGQWYLWIFGLCSQFFMLWMMFCNTHSLHSIMNNTSGHVTLHHAVYTYGNIGNVMWFWFAVILCGFFIFITLVGPWLLEDNHLPS